MVLYGIYAARGTVELFTDCEGLCGIGYLVEEGVFTVSRGTEGFSSKWLSFTVEVSFSDGVTHFEIIQVLVSLDRFLEAAQFDDASRFIRGVAIEISA